MFTQGIIQDNIKYIEKIRDLDEIRTNTLEDFIYCLLVEIEMNVNDEKYALEAENYRNRLTNNIKFPRREDFFYAKILNNKSFLIEFIDWLKKMDISFFDFQIIPIYDITVDLDDYIRFDKWVLQINLLNEKLEKKCNKIQQM
jgi:hypothetical protein